MNNFQKI